MKLDKFLEFFVDILPALFIGIIIAAFCWCIWSAVETEQEQRAVKKAQTAVCYSQGMVLVDTDAGVYCADSKSLVKIAGR